jgi:hypothetical protein
MKVNLQECLNIIGKPINSKEVLVFMDSYQFKIPKKNTISNKASDRSFWIVNKKMQVDLLFSIDVKNKEYAPPSADKKGVYFPILTHILFNANKVNMEFPFGIDFKQTMDQVISKMGNYTIKSSDIANVWLEEDGSENFYRWRKPIEKTDFEFHFDYWNDRGIKNLWLGIVEETRLVLFYDRIAGESYHTFVEKNDYYDRAYLLFVLWAINHHFITTDNGNSELLQKIRNKEVSVFEYLKHQDKGYLAAEDFCEHQYFVRKYTSNLMGNDVSFDNDVINTFLNVKDSKLYDGYVTDKGKEYLNQAILVDNASYLKIEKILDKRLKEFLRLK